LSSLDVGGLASFDPGVVGWDVFGEGYFTGAFFGVGAREVVCDGALVVGAGVEETLGAGVGADGVGELGALVVLVAGVDRLRGIVRC
jgi:hypothetical protein